MRPRPQAEGRRFRVLRVGIALAGLVVVGQLFRIQVLSHGFYEALASGQHDIFLELFPERGRIYATDRAGGEYVVATNRKLALVFAEPFRLKDPTGTAKKLGEIFDMEDEELAALEEKLSDPERRYWPVRRKVPDEQREKVEALGIEGLRVTEESHRFYPEGNAGAQVVGFLGADGEGGRAGQYGIEGFFDEVLAGEQGFLESERDSVGRLIVVGDHSVSQARDGSDVILTVDRAVQHVVCGKLEEWVRRHGAERGSVVVLEPGTGAVRAMCSAPSFDPNAYNLVDSIDVYNNTAIFMPYEPGSVFKAITMAAGLDAGKVTPDTIFDDEGEVKIGPHTIRNSDLKAHGRVTMTDVLTESLNTGMVEVASRLGPEIFRQYVRDFGFGQRTDIDLQTELAGDVSSLDKRGDIWSATASFGQGLTVTQIQLAAAYGAIANGGVLMKPRIVSAVRAPNGELDERPPKAVRRVISERAAKLITGMLVTVVERGHGTKAAVPGHWIAGKTGTAQIARRDGVGYEQNETIGSFVGFGPIDDPRFVIAVRIDRPKTVQFAESSAAPLFGDIASYLVDYYAIPPSRSQ